jgi:hypothetical protein
VRKGKKHSRGRASLDGVASGAPGKHVGGRALETDQKVFTGTVLHLVREGRKSTAERSFAFGFLPSASLVPGDAVVSRSGDAAGPSQLPA